MPSSKFNPESVPSLLDKKVYVVTGGNAGMQIHRQTTRSVWRNRVHESRSEGKAMNAIEEIKKEAPEGDIRFVQMDLQKLETVVEVAKEIRSKETALHGLINNAGIMNTPFEITADGYEGQFQTNYVSHWLLTYQLLPLFTATAMASPPGTVRIVNVTSDGHSLFAPSEGIKFDDINMEVAGSMTRYGQSKLGNVLHAKELNRRYGPGSGVEGAIWTAAVHPGHIHTSLGTTPKLTSILRCMGILDDVDNGSISSVFAIASADFKESHSGGYVVPYAKIGKPSKNATN
ncbi:hypothetical protein ACLX1H_006449 [Fusarium chlamydosporum]